MRSLCLGKTHAYEAHYQTRPPVICTARRLSASYSSAAKTLVSPSHKFYQHFIELIQAVLKILCIQVEPLQKCIYFAQQNLIIHCVLRKLVSDFFAV
jgi:hypothetical protein